MQSRRIFIHVKDAIAQDHKSVMIKANHTDVIVIALGHLSNLISIGLEKLWIEFGQGKNTIWIPIHDIKDAIGRERCEGILVFFMPFRAVTMYLHSRVKERNLLGKLGTSVRIYPAYLQNSVNTPQSSTTLILIL